MREFLSKFLFNAYIIFAVIVFVKVMFSSKEDENIQIDENHWSMKEDIKWGIDLDKKPE